MIGRPPTPVMERLMPRVVIDGNGCWIWTGNTTAWGYGHVWDQGRNRRVHRVTYEHLVGPISDGMQLDHLCRVRLCCNPEHLEPVTPRENTRRSPLHAGARTQCPQNHPYDEANTYIDPRGARICRACRAARRRKERAAA